MRLPPSFAAKTAIRQYVKTVNARLSELKVYSGARGELPTYGRVTTLSTGLRPSPAQPIPHPSSTIEWGRRPGHNPSSRMMHDRPTLATSERRTMSLGRVGSGVSDIPALSHPWFGSRLHLVQLERIACRVAHRNFSIQSIEERGSGAAAATATPNTTPDGNKMAVKAASGRIRKTTPMSYWSCT
ncbi:hypothetical protein CHU98_g4414 [Xylaria longipes]|nr:hypothetical protein CHU98_g4414 [Xylaria longipes]